MSVQAGKPFFHIVMPMYNAAATVQKAIKSLQEQSFTDWCLTIVDDASTDDSFTVCSAIAAKDTRITVKRLNQNSGQSAARNVGLEDLCGAYITFIDADDYIDTEVFYNAYMRLNDNSIEVLKYSISEEYFDKHGRFLGNKKLRLAERVYTNKISVRYAIIELEKMSTFGYVNNSFYKRELFERYNFSFDNALSAHEDFYFNMDVFKHVNTMAIMAIGMYHYVKADNNSMTNRSRNAVYYQEYFKKIDFLLFVYERWQLLTPNIKSTIFWFYVRYVYAFLGFHTDTKAIFKSCFDDVANTVLYQRFKRVEFEDISLKQKILIGFLCQGNSLWLWYFCKIIHFCRTKMRYLFAMIKD